MANVQTTFTYFDGDSYVKILKPTAANVVNL